MKSSRNLPDNLRSTMDLPPKLRDAVLGIPFPADMLFDIKYAKESGILDVYSSLYADTVCWLKTNYKIGNQTFADWAEFSFGVETSRDKMHEMVQECVTGLEARKDSVAAGADYRSPIQKTFDYATEKFREKFGFNPSGELLNKVFDDAPN